MADIAQVSQADFEGKVLKSNLPVLVDFWAEWCGPCRMVAPVVEELARDLAGKLSVCKVDVDANPQLAEKYGIQSIPALLVFKDGKVAKTLIGYMPKPEIAKALAEAGVGP